MNRLARVLFHMNSCNADLLFRSILQIYLDISIRTDWLLKLRDLVSFGKIGVEVILSRKGRLPGNGAIRREPHPQDEFNNSRVQHREDTGKTEADRADVGVRLTPERSRAGTQCFRFCQQLGVDFKPDD